MAVASGPHIASSPCPSFKRGTYKRLSEPNATRLVNVGQQDSRIDSLQAPFQLKPDLD